ncbi:MAG TPA: LptE family protein [Candidatus Acidoferrales bacterium]|nr:LptE family protein [Candidatus Acidoferrales bacterium]
MAPSSWSTTGRQDAQSREARTPFSFSLTWLCVLAASAGLSIAGCGYHVAGRGSRLPASVKTIAVPALENRTAEYRIEQRLTEALVHELLARTSYRVVSNPAGADAVLRGQIKGLESNALLFDTATGRATTMLVTVRVAVQLEENSTKKTLYRNDDFLFREQYVITANVTSFFEEQNPALDRLARDFALKLVAAVLENF